MMDQIDLTMLKLPKQDSGGALMRLRKFKEKEKPTTDDESIVGISF